MKHFMFATFFFPFSNLTFLGYIGANFKATKYLRENVMVGIIHALYLKEINENGWNARTAQTVEIYNNVKIYCIKSIHNKIRMFSSYEYET